MMPPLTELPWLHHSGGPGGPATRRLPALAGSAPTAATSTATSPINTIRIDTSSCHFNRTDIIAIQPPLNRAPRPGTSTAPCGLHDLARPLGLDLLTLLRARRGDLGEFVPPVPGPAGIDDRARVLPGR